MRLILVAALVICTLYQPLSACINDSATKADEQQFASGYGGTKVRKAPAPTGFQPAMLLLVLPSLALLGVGIVWLRQERALNAKHQQRRLGRGPDSE